MTKFGRLAFGNAGATTWFCLFTILAATFGLAASAAEKVTLPDFLLRSWNSDDGLPAGHVQAVARTADGYLWVGTSHGLARFDGVRFVTLTTNDTPALADNRVTCLLVTPSGDLWVGTENGSLARRHDNKFERIPLPSPAPGRRLTALAQDLEGSMWVSTRGSGVARWCRGEWDVFTQTNGLPANGASQLVADKQGRLWAISGAKLVTFEAGRWEVAAELSSVTLQRLALAPASDGGLWVAVGAEGTGDMGGRVFKIKDRQLLAETEPYPWPQNTFHTNIRVLFEDASGRLWAGMATAGIYYLDPGSQWQALAPTSVFSQILVNCLAEDDRGNLWVGLDGAQLDQVRTRPVRTLHLPAAASQNVIRIACVRQDGSVWVGTDGAGVFRFQHGNWTQYSSDEGLHNRYIGVLFEDMRSNLWAGTWDGLFRLDGNRFTQVLSADTSRIVVRAMFEDRAHNLWLGTSAGVVRLNGGRAKAFPGIEDYAGADVIALAEDASGTL